MVLWIDPPESLGYRDRIAWWPVVAYDTYTKRRALVWLREVREFEDGRVIFSSFAL